MPLGQEAKKGAPALGGVADPDFLEEIVFKGKLDTLFTMVAGDSSWSLLALPCPVTKVYVKIQQPNPSRMTKR